MELTDPGFVKVRALAERRFSSKDFKAFMSFGSGLYEKVQFFTDVPRGIKELTECNARARSLVERLVSVQDEYMSGLLNLVSCEEKANSLQEELQSAVDLFGFLACNDYLWFKNKQRLHIEGLSVVEKLKDKVYGIKLDLQYSDLRSELRMLNSFLNPNEM
jgi:hypothetical protein